MKRKSFLLIASVFAMSLGLVACGGTPAVSSEASSVASETSVASVTSSVSSAVDYTAITITNKEALQATWYAGEANRTVELSGTPEFNPTALIMSGELKVTSSNPAMVQVNGLVLTALDAGSVSITVRLGNVMDTVTITVNPVIALVKKTATVPELIEAVKAMDQTTTVIDNKTLYTVTGYAADIQNSSYGDFNLYSEDYAASIIVYGSSTTSSCLTISKTAGIDSEVSFKNPGDFVYGTTVHEGDKVTMSVVLEGYKGKPEILGWIDSSKTVAASENKTLKATINYDDAAHGSAVLSQSENIYVGQELTLTVTPATNYKVNTVKFNGTQLTASASDENVFVFNASYKNVIDITFAETSAPVITPVIATKTLAAVAAATVADDTVIEVSGIVGKVYDNTKGNFYLDDADGNEITVYGSSATATDFVMTDTKTGYYTGAYTANSNFTKEGVHSCEAGDYVTLQCVVVMFNTTPELTGYIKSAVKPTDAAYTYTFKAGINTPENGTATISKSEGLTFGEKVVITATPATGYKVDSIVVNHGKLFSESVVADSEGAYSFTANAINNVVVSFASSTPASLASYSTGFEATDGFTASTVYNATTEKVDGAEGKQWGIYYGTVSTSNKISDASSLQLRWYASTSTAIPYAYTKFNVANVTGVSFKAYVGAATVGVDVLYSVDYGTTWATLKSFAAGDIATSATAYTANFTAKQDQCRIKFQLNGTAPASSSTKFVLDDFAFVTA